MTARPPWLGLASLILAPVACGAGAIVGAVAENPMAGGLATMGFAGLGALAAVVGFARRERLAAPVAGLVLSGSLALCAIPFAVAWQELLRAGSVEDPTSYRDDELRFTVRAPDDSWLLLSPEEARNLNPDAGAGAVRASHGVVGLVFVAPAYDATVDTLVDLRRRGCGGELGEVTAVRWNGLDARRFACRASEHDVDLRYEQLIATRAQSYVQLFVSGLASRASERFEDADAFFDAVELLEGEPRFTDGAGHRADAAGPGWRVRGAIFESASAALRIELDEATTVHAGDHVDAFDPFAEVALTRRVPPVVATLAAENVRGLDLDALLEERRQQIASFRSGEPLPPLEVRLHGRRVELTRTRERNGWNEDLMDGLVPAGDRLYQIFVSAPSVTEPERIARELLASVRLLSDVEASALAAELDAVGHVQSGVGPTWVIRDGIVRELSRGIAWTLPHPGWRVYAGDAARARDEDERLLFLLRDPRRGLEARLLALPAGPLVTLHTGVLEDYAVAAPPPRGVLVGEAEGVRSSGTDGGALGLDVTTAAYEGRSHALVVSGAHGEVERGAVDALVSGLRIESPRPATEVRGSTYEDRRLGFAYTSPFDAEPTPLSLGGMDNLATARLWTRGRAAVGVTAVHVPGGDPTGQARRNVERMIETQFGGGLFVSRDEAEITLAGLPARHRVEHSLQRQSHVVTAYRGSVLFVLFSRGTATDPSIGVERLTRGFHLLP